MIYENFLVILATLSFALGGLTPTRAKAAELLSTSEQAKVISAIDSTCGDTWCEGDFGFRFTAVHCNVEASRCELDFEMAPNASWAPVAVAQGTEFEAKVSPTYQVSCSFGGVRQIDDLIDQEGFGLKSSPYNQLSLCIDALSKHLPNKAP